MLRAALSLFTIVLSLGFAELAFRLFTREGQFYETSEVELWKAQLRARPSNAGAESNIEYDPILGWRMRRSFRYEDAAGVISHNSRGFRGSAEFAEQPDSRLRVLALGASMAYGLGMTDEAVFSARLADTTGAEVINAGVNAFGVDQSLLMWEQEGRRLQPAVVALVYHVDDFYRVGLPIRDLPKPYFVEDGGRFRLEGVPVPHVAELSARGILAPAQPLRVAQAAHWLVRRARWRLAAPASAEMARLERLNEHVLALLRASVAESGARLVVLLAGHCARNAEFLYSGPVERKLVQSLGLESIDLATAMEQRENAYGGNCHWSARAHEEIAAELAARLGLSPAP